MSNSTTHRARQDNTPITTSVTIQRVALDGWQAPHTLTINISGRISETIDDGIFAALRARQDELHAEVAPAVARAINSILQDWRKLSTSPAARAAAKRIESSRVDYVFIDDPQVEVLET